MFVFQIAILMNLLIMKNLFSWLVEFSKGQLATVLTTGKWTNGHQPAHVALSPDLNVVAIGTDSSIYIYSTSSGELLSELKGVHNGKFAGSCLTCFIHKLFFIIFFNIRLVLQRRSDAFASIPLRVSYCLLETNMSVYSIMFLVLKFPSPNWPRNCVRLLARHLKNAFSFRLRRPKPWSIYLNNWKSGPALLILLFQVGAGGFWCLELEFTSAIFGRINSGDCNCFVFFFRF